MLDKVNCESLVFFMVISCLCSIYITFCKIQICSGITSGRVLNGMLYAQRLHKLIYGHLLTSCFMKISLQLSERHFALVIEENLHETAYKHINFCNLCALPFISYCYAEILCT